jgi:aspartate carbamoyltransferase regulatory subunit
MEIQTVAPEVQISARDADIARFASKVDLPDDVYDTVPCWSWQGARHSARRGYGKFYLNGKTVNAHKASYLLFIGEVAEGLVIGHQCDNENCVSPHHLKAETQSENMRHCVAVGRHVSQQK